MSAVQVEPEEEREPDEVELPDYVLDRVVRLLLDAEVAGGAQEGETP